MPQANHPPAPRPFMRGILRLIACSVPFGAFAGLAVAYFQAKITLTISGLLFIFFTACAGAFDSTIIRSFPKNGIQPATKSIWANTAVFTLIMSFTAPVIIVTVFFAACMFTASNTY